MRANGFLCPHCGKGSSSKGDLKRHGKHYVSVKSHLLTKYSSNPHRRATIPCQVEGCERSFIQSSALTIHARTHTGEKPCMCEVCARVRLCCFYMAQQVTMIQNLLVFAVVLLRFERPRIYTILQSYLQNIFNHSKPLITRLIHFTYHPRVMIAARKM
jgi:hypothetical protein